MNFLQRFWRFLFAPPLRFVPSWIRFGLCERDGWQPVYLFKWDYAENRMNYYACVACGDGYSVSEVTPWGSAVAIVYDLLHAEYESPSRIVMPSPNQQRSLQQAIRRRWAIPRATLTAPEGK